MRKTLAIALALTFAVAPLVTEARGSRGAGSHSSKGGHYAGGAGSSHKGGTYKNARTNDHYQKR
ncbi:hypothetical protein PAN31108_04453 [Pandoraea anhela]|uniref:Uncharacterized protein n=1 Tax=Pandoraea anhela TaxID=2508295 RepID=A0A5E4YDF5_9BURK|nr:hypothetical protein PAN31108_04453 [Pandoraea anhela]